MVFTRPFRTIVSALALLVLLASCATREKSFEILTESSAGLGERINRDPAQWGALFGLAPDFFKRGEDAGDEPIKPSRGKGWLGIAMKLADPPPRDPASGDPVPAVEALTVFPLSGAEQAGLRAGDRIVALDGRRLSPGSENSILAHFRKTIARKTPGDTVRLKILRDGAALDLDAVLVPRLKTATPLKPHPDLDSDRGRFPDSLLAYALRKEKLAGEFRRTLEEIRDRTSEVMAPSVKGKDYNPFRLHEVNYVMTHPLDLPQAARQITGALAASFGDEKKSLPEALQTAMEELDVVYEVPAGNANRPADLAGYIDRLVKAIVEAESLRKQALSGLSPEEIDMLYKVARQLLAEEPGERGKEVSDEDKRRIDAENTVFLNTALKVRLAPLLNASLRVARAVDVDLLLSLKQKGARLERFGDGWTVTEEENLTVVQTAAGKVLIGGPGRNVYTEDTAVIIDLGGDDIYLNHAGGSTSAYPFAVVVDFSGDDLYSASADFSQGAGFFGGGFLVDLEGDDRYSARNYAQGTGIFGVGVLADLGGKDEYRSLSSAQGAGAFGIGLLAEGGGDDRYFADRFAQGFGFVKGFGAIVETAGNDEYFAGGAYPDGRDPDKSYESLSQGFGLGIRPYDTLAGASGGIGVIAEAGGNDTYVGDYFAQGASYWFALGILDDRKGHDKYISGRYSQGAGIHLSAGVLMDGEGDDIYLASYGVAQGCGHDLGVGTLLDNGGDDRYIAGVLSQGAGNANGIGVLNDNGGDDEYHIKGSGQGRGNFEPDGELGSFGFHFDTGGGKDYYSPGGKNNSLVFKTEWGIFADTN